MLHEVTAFQVDMRTAFSNTRSYTRRKFDPGIEARLMTQHMSLSTLQKVHRHPQGHLTCGFEYPNKVLRSKLEIPTFDPYTLNARLFDADRTGMLMKYSISIHLEHS